jgi:hypothetical protein
MIYIQPGIILNNQQKSFYDYLTQDLNIMEANNFVNPDIIYIIFGYKADNFSSKYIYVNVDKNIDNEDTGTESAVMYFKFLNGAIKIIEFDMQNFNYIKYHYYDIYVKYMYISGNSIESFKSCSVSTNLIDLNDFIFNLDLNKIYVVNLAHSIDRKDKFIEINNGVQDNCHFISAIKYSPGFIGCAMSHKLIVHNALLQNLNYIKICEDDCIINDLPIIETCLKHLIDNNYKWELLSCFIANLPNDVVISEKITINDKYKLLKINKWCSTVFNIYDKSAFKYFIDYDHNKDII